MTNHWIDIKNANVVLIMGSNAAEHHPISFKWILRAKDNGAVLIHVDPKFSRTSACCDLHVPIRPGTDLAFLGGLIRYIIAQKKYFKEYVCNYTNASFIVRDDYSFHDGLFSGYSADTRMYDNTSWSFKIKEDGSPLQDLTLEDEHCVFQILKKHYDRYNPENVSLTTGISVDKIMQVYEIFAATGIPDKAGTMLYAIGWTQHTVGVQNIRAAAIIQLLLGNIGVAGGGINALRGEPNVQGSSDHAIMYNSLPGYLPTPFSKYDSLSEYLKATTPHSCLSRSININKNRPKHLVSLLKGWFGDFACKENDFCYSLLPKIEEGEDYSYLYVMDKILHDKIRGGLIFAVNPLNSFPNTNKMRAALDHLDWLVVSELHHSETSDNWHRPGIDPSTMKTEVFLLPSAHRIEKSGSITNSGRWLQWFDKAVEPAGEARSFGDIYVPLINKLRQLYQDEGGVFPDPLLKIDWPSEFIPEEWTKRINGYFLQEMKVSGKYYQPGQLLPDGSALKDDGSTSSLNWLYVGSWTEEDGNKARRRDHSQTEMQAKIGLYPNWSWAWPANRRILYNLASVDLNGKAWNPDKPVIEWKGDRWEGDIPDGSDYPLSTEGKGSLPFIMNKDGLAQIFSQNLADGPLPEHYEPAETPIRQHIFSRQLQSPCFKFHRGEFDKLCLPADPDYPIVLTTYSMTEHWCGGGETRNVPNLLEAEPQLYVEISHELAAAKGIKNGDGVVVISKRGQCEAIAMVTVRIHPFTIMGRTVHMIGMPFAFGWTTPQCGDSTNKLTVAVADPNTSIPETKVCCVNIKKIDKLTELE